MCIIRLTPTAACRAGHYVPSLRHYIAFLDRLTDLGVDLSQVP